MATKQKVMIAQYIWILTALILVPQKVLIFRCCLHPLEHLNVLCKALHIFFRVLKTDLDLRPVYHKTDEASMAHLHLGLLAYWVVSAIRYQLKQQGINYGWSEIVRIMNTQKMVTTTIENTKGDNIQIRQCREPTQEV